ncbi:phage tail terminator family protein [Aerococcus urinaeequi]|uniref:phage tail terminator family protein n=1 Tax=Aerococcus urinaeequi TaxID=51665 RepID=UPI003EC743C2
MNLITAIVDELATLFQDGIFYIENQEQGFEQPSFYAYPVNNATEARLMGRQHNKQMFAVTYFPDPDSIEKGVMEQCAEVADKLMNDFRFIQSEGLHVLNKDIKLQNNVVIMNFYLKYNIKPDDEQGDTIGSMDIQGGLKNGGN